MFLDYLLHHESFEAAEPRLRRGAAVYAPSFFAPYVIAAALSGDRGRIVVAPDGEIAALYKEVARKVAVKVAERAKDYSAKFPTITISKGT